MRSKTLNEPANVTVYGGPVNCNGEMDVGEVRNTASLLFRIRCIIMHGKAKHLRDTQEENIEATSDRTGV